MLCGMLLDKKIINMNNIINKFLLAGDKVMPELHLRQLRLDEHNKKSARYNVGDKVRTSKFKNIFAKGYTPNWSREIFVINKINDTVPYTYNLQDLNDEEIIGSFYDRELQKTKL